MSRKDSPYGILDPDNNARLRLRELHIYLGQRRGEENARSPRNGATQTTAAKPPGPIPMNESQDENAEESWLCVPTPTAKGRLSGSPACELEGGDGQGVEVETGSDVDAGGVGGSSGEGGSRKRRGIGEFDEEPDGVDRGEGGFSGRTTRPRENFTIRRQAGAGEADSIVAFSPYAPRFSGGGDYIADDLITRTASSFEQLRLVGDGEDHRQNLQSPAKKHHVEKGSAGACGSGVARRIQFFHDGGRSSDRLSETAVRYSDPQGVGLEPMNDGESGVADGADPKAVPDESTSGALVEVEGCVVRTGVDARRSPSPAQLSGRTLLVYMPDCQLHMSGEGFEGHQERPERLEVLCGRKGALRRKAFRGLEWADPDCVKPAVVTDLLRVHEFDYLQHIQERCNGAPVPILRMDRAAEEGTEKLSSSESPGGTRRRSRATGEGVSEPEVSACLKSRNPTLGSGSIASSATSSRARRESKDSSGAPRKDDYGQRFRADPGYVDVDTRVSPDSYKIAKTAAGAVIYAVDRVMQGKNPNAFVAVRPPGHHAGPCGSVPSASFWKQPGMNSSGFCLLNNAAIGAAYARSRYGRTGELSRVAIVDIDIHHGNGTEEIVRCLRPVTTMLPLPPSWPSMTRTIYKPWLDESDPENVFFGSVSLQHKGSFYPASGTEDEEYADSGNIVNISLSALGPPPGEEPKKRALTKTKMNEYMGKATGELKKKCEKDLLPRLKDFSPDLLIISAGFDGHVEDYYHYISNESYEWITRELEACCPSGRLVSVLEGGYSLEPRMSRYRTAQQVRVSNRRSEIATAPGGSCTSASSSVTSGPTLRERRNRPATRRSTATGAGSVTATVPAVAPVVAPVSSVPRDSWGSSNGDPRNGKKAFSPSSSNSTAPWLSSACAVENSVTAASQTDTDAGQASCGVSKAPSLSRGLAPNASAPAAKLPNGGPSSCVDVGVGGTSLFTILDDPGRRPKKHSVESLCSDVVGSCPQDDEDADGSEYAVVLTPADGGLVCGVVSHVKALTALASRKFQTGNA